MTPNRIVSGGVSGLGTILYHTLSVPPGVTFFLFNLLFLALGAVILGRAFVWKTLLGAVLISLFVQLFSLLPIPLDDPLPAALSGGILYGFGGGLSFAAGASTGGTDILARIVQHYLPQMSVGKLLGAIDGVIIGLSMLVFRDVTLGLYGVLALAVESFTVDFLIRKLNESCLAFIITDCGDAIGRALVASSPRGVTVLRAKGAYTDSERQILFCALKHREVAHLQDTVLAIDPGAFIVFTQSEKIKGNGFILYR